MPGTLYVLGIGHISLQLTVSRRLRLVGKDEEWEVISLSILYGI